MQDPFKNRNLDLAPGAAEVPSDVVRTYLREAGRISLLTRRAEVEVAKRIERGQLNTLKAEFPKVKVVMVTKVADEACRKAVLNCGADAFLSKAAEVSSLLSAIDKVLFRPRMPLQSAATGLTKRT